MPDERNISVRDATAEDAAAIARIYNQGIEERQATLETQPRTPEERAAWLAAREARRPALVALVAGEVAGWASLNAFNPRAVYDHVADISVYVAREWRGRGVGSRLLKGLEERAGAQLPQARSRGLSIQQGGRAAVCPPRLQCGRRLP